MALINGINYDWGNLNFTAFNNLVIGVTKIEYKREQVKENNYAWGLEPVSRGYGKITYTGSLTIYLDEWYAICKAAPNGDPLQIPWTDVSLTAVGTGVIPFTDTLHAFEFTSNPMNSSEGDTKILLDIPFIYAGLDRFN